MPRWIGIDYGKVRTGLAVTDGNALIASPFKTVPTKDLMAALDALVSAEPCAGFALGIPNAWSIQLHGTGTDSTAGILELKDKLSKKWSTLTVHLVDESNTSKEARQALIAGGMPKKKRQIKGAMDHVAAALILQRFLGESST